MVLQDQTARNRINQRNFRSRRQQYIKELEEKLRAFETAGVQATTRVQQAARVVVRENAVLRSLVRETTGCSEQQLNSYLSLALRPEAGQTGETRSMADRLRQTESSSSIDLYTNKNQLPATETGIQPGHAARVHPPCLASETQPQPGVGSGLKCCRPPKSRILSDTVGAGFDASSNGGSMVTVENSIDLGNHESFNDVSVEMAESQLSDSGRRQGPSMSCEEAAIIISSISVMDGSRDIREKLGCTSGNTCTVNNMEVFQVMGEAI